MYQSIFFLSSVKGFETSFSLELINDQIKIGETENIYDLL